MQSNLGYACINMTLREQGITTNRRCTKRTFETKGLDHISNLVLANVTDLKKIIQWNHENGVMLFRISSSLFPWFSKYELHELKDSAEILLILMDCGRLADEYGQRLSFHPGQFCVLASPNEAVVANAIIDLDNHGMILDFMGLSQTPYNKINIHVGGAYGDKASALERFCTNFNRLATSTKCRLTVENDDKANMFSVQDLYDGVHKIIGIPIVFDYHHHKFCTGDLTEQQALKLAMSTWPDTVKPCTHYSEGRDIEYAMRGIDEKVTPRAHSDYIYNEINDHGYSIDIMVESKAKELAIIEYSNKYPLGSQKELVY
jgi:UV DNA damage endonuclease